ncbi:MAG: hypothetical protein HY711_02095 [Candidatus Melainabacteria bacterium]|nr:hypothetical protein [Candidatus Melainabacteria bacterium]
MPYRQETSVSKMPERHIYALALAGFCFMLSAYPASAKRLVMQMPSYSKLCPGAGPETNDSKIKGSQGAQAANLVPVKLNEPESTQGAKADNSSPTYLKSTITATGFAPKVPVDPTSKSLFAPKETMSGQATSGSNLFKQARNVNAMPLPLLESTEEAQKRVEAMLDAEKTQLADLWEATLTRSPDIQFVVQKLMPTSNPGHTSTILMRMLSSTIFGAMGAVNMMAPNAGVYAGSSMGASMIMNVLQLQESKQAQKAKLSQTEAIMLYNMVRSTADKLVETYRSYKKVTTQLSKSLTDLQDLQNMIAEARSGQDAAKQLEMEYTIRKAQRDVDATSEDVHRYRQGLVDLAGVESIAKLDKQLEEEQTRIEQATPVGTPSNTQTASGPGTQS